jgi:hypothetical protein
MSEEMGGLEDMMMGNVSEEASESSEKIAARLAAAQKKIAAVQRDEKKSHTFDEKLSKILPSFSITLLEFVIFLIDKEVPSCTILAMISIESDAAGKICFKEFHKFIEEAADFSIVKFDNKEVEKKVSMWWTFIFAADHISKTTKLNSFRKDEEFVGRLSSEFSRMLKDFLLKQNVQSFDEKNLKKILKQYADAAFSDNPLD